MKQKILHSSIQILQNLFHNNTRTSIEEKPLENYFCFMPFQNSFPERIPTTDQDFIISKKFFSLLSLSSWLRN